MYSFEPSNMGTNGFILERQMLDPVFIEISGRKVCPFQLEVECKKNQMQP